MKSKILKLERQLLLFWPVRMAIRFLLKLLARIMWLWGRIKFGAQVQNRGLGCVCAWNADLKYPERLFLGDRVVIGTNVSVGAHSKIALEDDVRLSRDVIIETAGLDFSRNTPPFPHISKPITLKKGVWVGARAIILGGVSIGEHSVVAAGSVVTKSFPAGSVIAGVPAKQISILELERPKNG